jgi:hypothetical protein
MQKLILATITATLMATALAFAQTTAPSTPPTTVPPAVAPAPAMPAAGPITLTDQQAKAWVDKKVYSSDDKKLGEVAAFARDASGTVTEMHADVGGFLGLGETRVRIMPAQFRFMNDHVMLLLTAEQAKALPKITK